jgi:hypothetical protein
MMDGGKLIKGVAKVPGDVLTIRIKSLGGVKAAERCVNIFRPRSPPNFSLQSKSRKS